MSSTERAELVVAAFWTREPVTVDDWRQAWQQVYDAYEVRNAEVERLREALGNLNDLRGQTVREVHRDDAVIISGGEYLRLKNAVWEQRNSA